MASWFNLYLYTEGRNTEYITANIEKKSKIEKELSMSRMEERQHDIVIDEGTSHWIEVTVKSSGTVDSLTGCSAVFTSKNNGIDIEKECLIEQGIIKVKLEPEETKGYLSKWYQIRVFDSNDDVFQVIQGIIHIVKAHNPYIQNPLGG